MSIETEASERRARWIVGAIVVIGYFSVVVFMIWHDKNGVEILIGGLAAAFGAVVNYGFGSSQGSEAKSRLLAQSIPMPVVTDPEPKEEPKQ